MEHGLLHATHSSVLVLLLRDHTLAVGGGRDAAAVPQQQLDLS